MHACHAFLFYCIFMQLICISHDYRVIYTYLSRDFSIIRQNNFGDKYSIARERKRLHGFINAIRN